MSDIAATASPDPAIPWEALFGADGDSFADVLRQLRGLVPRALIDGEGWTRLLDRVADVPAAAAVFFGFEFRLGDPEPAADVCVPAASDVAETGTRELPIVQHFVREARGDRPRSPSRAALAQCIGGFGRADSTLARWAGGVLLEYDIAASGAANHSTPGIYFALRRKAGPAGHDVLAAARRNIAPTLAKACGWTPDAAEQREVERLIDAIPPGARLGQAGAMPDRAGRAIRLVVYDVDSAVASAFLERLGWSGPIAFAAEILADQPIADASFAVSLDVTAEGPAPRLGLELFAKRGSGWQHTTRRDWEPGVAWLVERGWCTAAKARGLLEWPGHQKMYDRTGVFLAHQGINHLKITVAGEVVAAKGYVGMSLVPLTAA